MKIAVTATGDVMDAEVDPRFGRCAFFAIYESESRQLEAVANKAAEQSGGAGVAAAQLVQGKGAQVVLTGNVGPNAFQALNAAGIGVVVGVSGKVSEVVKRYLDGEYELTKGASVERKHGMGQ